MNKKVIITEQQYDNLKKFIVETQFDKLVKNVVKVGDIIRIEFKNSVNNFKVIKNDIGQIQMDNIDTGSANINYRYFITQSSLHGDDLEFRRVHKTKEQDKISDIKKWQRLEVKDIKNIDIIRNGSIIDTVDTPTPTDNKVQTTREKGQKGKPDSEEFKTKVDDVVLVFIKNIKEGNGLTLNFLNKDVINFCCVSKSQSNFSFTLDSNTKIDELKVWDTFNIEINGTGELEDEDLYELNKNIIKTTDGGQSLNIRLRGFSGEKSKDFWIKGISDIQPTPLCASVFDEKAKEDNTEKEKEKEVDYWRKPQKTEDEAKAMMQAIINDPLMKKAFYKQPTLWNLIVSAVKGVNPKGTGINPAMKIINQYKTKDNKLKIGSTGNNFKTNKPAKFEIIETEFFMNPTGNPSDILKLEPNATYKAWVNEYKLGDEYLTLSNKKLGFKILIKKELKDIANGFDVIIVKIVEGKKTGEIREYPKEAKIRFKNERGSGYSNEISNI